ncbi:unnamed protein product [Knipowitschia caucasica]
MDASDSMANGSSSVDCFRDPPTFYIFISIAVVTLLLMPVSLYILYLGFSQWKQRRAASHLDHFTYHMSAMDLLPFCGCIVFCVGACYDNIFLMSQSLALFSFNWSAKIHLNTLTCVDRYLAVVHPISYLNLKRRAGVKIRNGAIAFLWLLGLACISLLYVKEQIDTIFSMLSMILAFIISFFCNVAVLRALVRPSPAKEGGKKAKVDLSKKKAFQTVAAILAVLFWGTIGILLCETVSLTVRQNSCVSLNASILLNFPCNLVLPILFLQRSGKLSKRKVDPSA